MPSLWIFVLAHKLKLSPLYEKPFDLKDQMMNCTTATKTVKTTKQIRIFQSNFLQTPSSNLNSYTIQIQQWLLKMHVNKIATRWCKSLFCFHMDGTCRILFCINQCTFYKNWMKEEASGIRKQKIKLLNAKLQ